MDNRRADLREVLRSALEKAIGLRQSLVAGYVARLRRAGSDATPAEVIAVLEKQYLRAATGTGAAVGGAAVGGAAAAPCSPSCSVIVAPSWWRRWPADQVSTGQTGCRS
jgi:hypothetical protein